MSKKETNPEFVTIGKFGAPYGVKGWVKIHSYAEYDTDILSYSPWYIELPNGTLRAITIEDGRIHSNTIIVKIEGYDVPETVSALTNSLIVVERSLLPDLDDGEYYWSQLEGLDVIDQHGNNIGKVAYLMETGANDVLVVKGEIEQLIPYVKDQYVTKVDLEKGEIHVDWEAL